MIRALRWVTANNIWASRRRKVETHELFSYSPFFLRSFNVVYYVTPHYAHIHMMKSVAILIAVMWNIFVCQQLITTFAQCTRTVPTMYEQVSKMHDGAQIFFFYLFIIIPNVLIHFKLFFWICTYFSLNYVFYSCSNLDRVQSY